MKRFQQLPTESAKIGRILFWLFPDDQSMFYRRGTWAHRTTRGTTHVRGYHGARQQIQESPSSRQSVSWT
jgi:hypothetical protein